MSGNSEYGWLGLLWFLGCAFMVYIIRAKKMQSDFKRGLKLIMFSFLLGLTLLLIIIFS